MHLHIDTWRNDAEVWRLKNLHIHDSGGAVVECGAGGGVWSAISSHSSAQSRLHISPIFHLQK